MKKLMTMMGAVAMSFGLFADAEAWSSVKYDDALQAKEKGATEIVGVDDVGTTTDAIHWWIDGFEAGTIAQPAVVSNDTDTTIGNYLKVETDKGSPMLRTLNAVEIKEVEEVNEASYAPVGITDHGLFIDTKVRMTGTEDAPAIDAQNKNKLLVWLQTIDADDTVDPAIEGSTNLMVTCGYVDEFNVITPTNYVLDVDVNVGDWVQLTIRADKGEKNVPAFKIFVNEQQVASVDGLDVFPSLIGGADTIALSAAGFDGTGDINYVNLLSENDAPAFAADPTFLKVTWNEGVASFTVGEQTIEVTGAGATNLVVAAGDAVVTPAFVQTPKYKLAGFTLNDVALPDDEGAAKFNIPLYGNPTLEIAAVQDRIGANLVVDGETVGDFAFVKDAVAALNDKTFIAATIKLVQSETIDDFGDWSVLSGNITLDLAGKTVTVDTEKTWAGKQSEVWGEYALIDNASATITITDTVGGGALIGSATVALICNNATMYLAKTDTDITYAGNIYSQFDDETVYGTLTIYGGKFKPKAEFTDEYNGLAEGLDWSPVDGEGFYTVIEAADYVAQIGDNRYKTLAEAYEAAAEAGDTITLLANCSGNGITIAKSLTIDFDDCTYTVNFDPAGSTGTKSQAFQILKEAGAVTFKNGTITSTDVVKMLVNNYTDLTLDGMTLDGTNMGIAHKQGTEIVVPNYTLSNNNGTTTLTGDTVITSKGTGHFAMDTYDSTSVSYPGVPTVVVNGATINGDVELTGGNLTLTAGTLNGALVATAIGDGVITKGDAFEADAPAGYVWKDGVLTKMAEPTADVTAITAEGYDVAVRFDADDQGAGYDDWQAKFILTSDVAIGVDEIALGGSYEAWQEGAWIDIPFAGCEANEPVSIAGDLDVTVDDLFTFVESFKCGVKNVALKNDATFSLALVISDPEGVKEDIPLCSLNDLKVKAKETNPWADIENSDIEGVDDTNKEAVEATLDAIKEELAGDEKAVAGWITEIYGNTKVPASAFVDAKNIDLSVKYDLPLMQNNPTVEFVESAETAGAFEFQIKDGETALELKQALDKIKSMVEFTDDLTKTFGEAGENIEVALKEDDTKTATATFTKKTDAGFMRVNLKK